MHTFTHTYIHSITVPDFPNVLIITRLKNVTIQITMIWMTEKQILILFWFIYLF